MTLRLAIAGASGQLGTDLCAAAVKRLGAGGDVEVTPLTRDILDVTDTDAVNRQVPALDCDALVNCTSYHKTDEVEGEGTRAVAVNAHAAAALAQACAAADMRFVHISTDYVFGGNSASTPLTEEAPPAPVNVYGASKLLGETLVRLAHPDALILRTASLFGVAGASGKGGNFVETMIRLARERGHLRVVADQIMSPTATADLAGWILTLLENGAPGGLYHAVNTGAESWHGFAARIIARAGIDAEVEAIPSSEFPTPARRPAYSALDNAKLAAIAGPLRPWQDALDDYLKAKGYLG